MARITFKAKVQTMHYVDGSIAYQYLQVPQFTRAHCDMAAFRKHPKYGAYANSDLFLGMLKRIRADVFNGQPLKMGDVPPGVNIDTSGFLAVVTLDA